MLEVYCLYLSWRPHCYWVVTIAVAVLLFLILVTTKLLKQNTQFIISLLKMPIFTYVILPVLPALLQYSPKKKSVVRPRASAVEPLLLSVEFLSFRLLLMQICRCFGNCFALFKFFLLQQLTFSTRSCWNSKIIFLFRSVFNKDGNKSRQLSRLMQTSLTVCSVFYAYWFYIKSLIFVFLSDHPTVYQHWYDMYLAFFPH